MLILLITQVNSVTLLKLLVNVLCQSHDCHIVTPALHSFIDSSRRTQDDGFAFALMNNGYCVCTFGCGCQCVFSKPFGVGLQPTVLVPVHGGPAVIYVDIDVAQLPPAVLCQSVCHVDEQILTGRDREMPH